MDIKKIIQLLKSGKVGVIHTDTIYGIVGSALDSKVVEKIYTLRKRSLNKPMIILISSISDLEKFSIKLTNYQRGFLEKIWPNPLSVVLPCEGERFKYLHRGTNALAFRIPNNEELLKILREVGPIVAPSANFEGEKSAENIIDAKNYFGDNVDLYVDGGVINSKASTLIELNDDSIKILRQGIFKV